MHSSTDVIAAGPGVTAKQRPDGFHAHQFDAVDQSAPWAAVPVPPCQVDPAPADTAGGFTVMARRTAAAGTAQRASWCIDRALM